VEHCCVINREVGRFYPWEVVDHGMIPHMITILRIGDIQLQSIAAGTFSVISQDDEICKLLFTNGCVKPILNITDADVTNESCMLAGLGCIIQLCRVPDIGVLTLQQGALAVLEKAFHRHEGQFAIAVREKALFALSWLSRLPGAKPLIATPSILAGLKRELVHGTLAARQTVVQMCLYLHNEYPSEIEFLDEIKGIILEFLLNGVWHVRNLATKCVCVLYRRPDWQMFFFENGALEAIGEIMGNKSQDLQEAPLVSLLSFLTHPDIPDQMWAKPLVLQSVVRLLACVDDVIRNLAVVIIKGLCLYDFVRARALVPSKHHYLFGFDDDMPDAAGSEYGGLIQEYLQQMVENRRDHEYLIAHLGREDFARLGVTRKSIQPYMDIFMELDPKCRSQMDIDGLKLVMISIGQEVEEDLVLEAFNRYDTDGSGAISFDEFVYMMEDYKKLEKGGMVKRMYNNTMNRGTVGRAKRKFRNFWNKEAIEQEQIRMAKDKRERARQEKQELAAEHWEAEKIKLKREEAVKARQRSRARGGTASTADSR
jgi:hypothetical protein